MLAGDPAAEPRGALHIREVVRITGLRREQLYMWQRRYGFPAPLRDSFGDRVYPPDQVARLKLIKQLLSEGWRAGAVVPLAEIGAAVDARASPSTTRRRCRRDRHRRASCSAQHRIGELQNHLSKLLVGPGTAQVPRADAHSAQRGRARARRARRDAELPGAALRRPRAAPAARRDAARAADARRAHRSCSRRRPTIRTSSASRSSSCCCSPKASTA